MIQILIFVFVGIPQNKVRGDECEDWGGAGGGLYIYIYIELNNFHVTLLKKVIEMV